MQQICGLYLELRHQGHELSLLLGEGDSTDNTRTLLIGALTHTGLPARVIDTTHGGPEYGSFENPERFKQIAVWANRIWANISENADIVIFVDSDLIWEPDMLATLVNYVQHDAKMVVAPRVLHLDNPYSPDWTEPAWYDTFAFRSDGIRFVNNPPYHHRLNGGYTAGSMVPLDSAGGCMVMSGVLARASRFSELDAIVGLCRDICAAGGNIQLAPNAVVYHP